MATDLQNRADPSLGDLVKGIVNDVQELTKQQFEMLRAEMKEDFDRTRDAGMFLVLGAVVLFVGGLVLLFALGFALSEWFPQTFSVAGGLALVGVVGTAAGGVLAFLGYQKFRSFNPLPDKTVGALQENLQWTNQK